jgi:ketosteroid isomerase-like protein
MLRKTLLTLLFACALAAPTLAQTTRRTTTTTPTTTPTATATTQETTTTTTTTVTPARSRARRTTPAVSAQAATVNPAGAAQVRAAFDKLLDGIRQSSVEQVMGVYWNSPRLAVFNNNGTVTRGATDYRSTREQIYAKVTGDVNLTVRDVRVEMLGRDGAIVHCLWTQEQTANGASESATGRMTVAFQRVGTEWKAVHTHTSPDAPDPSRLLPSERTTPAVAPTEVVPGARPTTTTPTTTRPATTSPTRP